MKLCEEKFKKLIFFLISRYIFLLVKSYYNIYIMLINRSSNTSANEIIIEKYNSLISRGVLPCEILFVVLNPYKKALFDDKFYLTAGTGKKPEIHTLNGLYYNAFKDNSSYIKSLLKYSDNDVLNQCGLEVSQYIFKQSIKDADFSDYISKINLLHQLFRRYSLIVQNSLSDKEVIERARLVNEVFAEDAFKAIYGYKQRSIEYKSFDYLRQAAIFPLIYKNTGYFNGIKYLIIDDADEMPYIFWQFADFIMPQIQDYIIAYDSNGSSRCGYLCAYKNGIPDFKLKYSPKEIVLSDKSVYAKTAENLFSVFKEGKKIKLGDIKHFGYVNRLDMLEKVFLDIKELIRTGVKPGDISVISPLSSELIRKCSSGFDLEFQSVSGSEKLSGVSGIKHIISILKLINNIDVSEYEIKSLLVNLSKIPYRKCHKMIKDFKISELFDFNFSDDVYNAKYKKLQNIVKSLKNTGYLLSEQIKIIYENLIKENIEPENLQKYEFLLKEAQTFEQAFSGKIDNFAAEFIIQMENSVISENPINSFKIQPDKVIISSPQKSVDYSIKTGYQLWIDVSNSEWIKQDTGTLYNAWVFSRDLKKNEYGFEDNIKHTNDKTARVIRKLMLCAQKEIRFYSSIYDSEGNENFGGLTDFILFTEQKNTGFKIIPRDDQKPVLDYKKGKMGIMAVPGAGKTTILLALVVKLINSKIPPENIFVLTYMESAAKNFKERIKTSIPDGAELPNISTIHGLALRIIKENGNYAKVGLDEKFEICDDSEKERIIKELFYKLKIQDDKYDNYLKCISIVKLADKKCNLQPKYSDIREFYRFLEEYNIVLKQKNLIDYDDMLKFAVSILKDNKDIREYYQNLCRYIIEDEAQDSTEIQQTLINLLSAGYNNVLRCGDINQSITSTFTNSNPDSFKDFIYSNKKIEMVSSQRCAFPIYTLANRMIESACKDEDKKQAFYSIKIQGTDDNPKSDTLPEYSILETEKEEKDFIIKRIKEIQKENPNASIAILLRLNADVNRYNEFITLNGIKTTVRTDLLSQKEIYKYIINVLNIIENPLNNKLIKELAMLYLQNSSIKEKQPAEKFFEDLKIPFININPDDLDSEILSQLYWDIEYWLNNADKNPEDIAFNIGLYYSKSSADKSNTYLISTFIRRLKENNAGNDLLKTIDYYSQKPMSTYKFFEDDVKKSSNAVHIMTMHKSKGDEFDYVFIPQLNEDNYPVEIQNVKLKSGGHFVETVRCFVQNNKIKMPDELKKEQALETLRLLYVGITRAKYGLFLSTAKHYKTRKNVKISEFISGLFSNDLIKIQKF